MATRKQFLVSLEFDTRGEPRPVNCHAAFLHWDNAKDDLTRKAFEMMFGIQEHEILVGVEISERGITAKIWNKG